MYFKDLFEVINVALSCMMVVFLFGTWYDGILPKQSAQTVYDCDVRMTGHILTVPCTIRGKYYAV